MKKIVLGLLLGILLDRAVYGGAMYASYLVIKKCGGHPALVDEERCYDKNHWKFLSMLTYYFP